MCAHRTMLKNIIQQFRLQLRTWGRQSPMLEAAFEGDASGLVGFMFQGEAADTAQAHGLDAGRLAESFRLERFGGLEGFFQQASEPIPGAPEPPRRPGLDIDQV